MTDEDSSLPLDRIEESRRSVMKKGAVAAAGTGLAVSGTGSAAAQDGTETDDDGESDKALMFTNQVRPGARFVITSPVLEWAPNVEEVRDNVWSEYNTRMIRYLNTQERAIFFQAHEAEVPDYDGQAGYVVDAEGDTADDGTVQPEVFELDVEPALFGTSPDLMTVNFSPVGEDEEDDVLEDEDWWLADGGDGGGNGTATGTSTGTDNA